MFPLSIKNLRRASNFCLAVSSSSWRDGRGGSESRNDGKGVGLAVVEGLGESGAFVGSRVVGWVAGLGGVGLVVVWGLGESRARVGSRVVGGDATGECV